MEPVGAAGDGDWGGGRNRRRSAMRDAAAPRSEPPAACLAAQEALRGKGGGAKSSPLLWEVGEGCSHARLRREAPASAAGAGGDSVTTASTCPRASVKKLEVDSGDAVGGGHGGLLVVEESEESEALGVAGRGGHGATRTAAFSVREAFDGLLAHFPVRREACLTGNEEKEGLLCKGVNPFCSVCRARLWDVFSELRKEIDDARLRETLARARRTAVLALCLNVDEVLATLVRTLEYRKLLCAPDMPKRDSPHQRQVALHKAVGLFVHLGIGSGLTYDASVTGLEGAVASRRCAAILRFVQITQHMKELLTSHLMIARDSKLQDAKLRSFAREELFRTLGNVDQIQALSMYVKYFEEVHITAPYQENGLDTADATHESIVGELSGTVPVPARRLIRLLTELSEGRAGERYLTHMDTQECVEKAAEGSLNPPPPPYVARGNLLTLQKWIRNVFGTSKEVLRCIHKPQERLRRMFATPPADSEQIINE